MVEWRKGALHHTDGQMLYDGWLSVGRGLSTTLMNRGGGVEEGAPPLHLWTEVVEWRKGPLHHTYGQRWWSVGRGPSTLPYTTPMMDRGDVMGGEMEEAPPASTLPSKTLMGRGPIPLFTLFSYWPICL